MCVIHTTILHLHNLCKKFGFLHFTFTILFWIYYFHFIITIILKVPKNFYSHVPKKRGHLKVTCFFIFFFTQCTHVVNVYAVELPIPSAVQN